MKKNIHENNEALCHAYVYAGEDEYGRNKGNTCRFDGNSFYSYETEICRKYPEKSIAVINSTWYSTTTSQQTWRLRRAFPDNWTLLFYPEVDIKKIPAHIKETIKNLTKKCLDKQNAEGIFKRKLDRDICFNIQQIINADIVKVPQTIKDLVDKNVEFELARKKKLRELQEKRYCQILEATKKDTQRMVDVFIKERQTFLEHCKKHLYDGDITLSKAMPILKGLFNNFCSDHFELITKYVNSNDVKKYVYEQIFGTINNCKEIFGYERDIDVVWLQDNNRIMTNRYVSFELTNETLKQFRKLAKYYLENPTDSSLVGKHVRHYCIGDYNPEYIVIGCHLFTYKNIELLYKELEALNVV